VLALIITGLAVLSLAFAQALVGVAGTNPYAGHVMFVPVVSALILWHRRESFRSATGQSRSLALLVFGASLALLAVAQTTPSYTAHTLSMILAIAGAVLWCGGTEWLRQAAFPLGFLFFMLPVPDRLVAAVTPTIQAAIATFTTETLSFFHVPVEQQGFMLRLPNANVAIDETCNGLRFALVAFVIATAFAQLLISTPSRRPLLMIAAIPAAFLANAIRVTEVTMATYLYGPQIAGRMHDYIGRGTWLLTIAVLLVGALLLERPARQVWFLRWTETTQAKKA
jgi:exosortase